MKLNLTYEASLTNVERGRTNSSFRLGTMRILATDVVANGTTFSKGAIQAAIPTLKNIPVVGLYKVAEEDFGGHEAHLILDEEEGFKMAYDTTPIGVIPESANVWFEVVEEQGQTCEYLCTDILLWKREKGVQALRKRKSFSVSMEIEVLDCEKSGVVTTITNFLFTAVCVLGSRVNPAFKSANIKVFNQEQDVQAMMFELETYMTNELGGERMNLDTILESSTESTDVPMTPEVEVAETEDLQPIEPVEADTPVEVVEEPIEEMEPVVETPEAESTEETEPTEEVEPTEPTEPTEETESTETEPAETEPKETFQQEYAQLVETLMEQTKAYETLEAEHNAVKAECEALRAFKADILAERRQDAEKRLFERFEALEGFDGFDTIKSNRQAYELDELETQLYALMGKKLFADVKPKSHSQSGTHVVFESQHPTPSSTGVFGLLDNYLPKK